MRKFLTSIKLLDESGIVSLTNVAVWTTLLKLFVSRNPTLVDCLAVAVALVAYNFKRWHGGTQLKEQQSLEARFDVIEKQLAHLKTVLSLKQPSIFG